MAEPSPGRVIRGWDDYSEKERRLILDHIMPKHLAAMGCKDKDPAAAHRRHNNPLYKEMFNRVHAGFSTDTNEVAAWPTEEQLKGPDDDGRIKEGIPIEEIDADARKAGQPAYYHFEDFYGDMKFLFKDASGGLAGASVVEWDKDVVDEVQGGKALIKHADPLSFARFRDYNRAITHGRIQRYAKLFAARGEASRDNPIINAEDEDPTMPAYEVYKSRHGALLEKAAHLKKLVEGMRKLEEERGPRYWYDQMMKPSP